MKYRVFSAISTCSYVHMYVSMYGCMYVHVYVSMYVTFSHLTSKAQTVVHN